MWEPAVAPALLKAVDWLFGEASKILTERRERAKDQGDDLEPVSSNPSTEPDETTIKTREEALQQTISEASWRDQQSNIEHLLSILEIQKRNYRLAKEKQAQWGDALVPPIVMNELFSAETAIEDTTRELQKAASKVFGKNIEI